MVIVLSILWFTASGYSCGVLWSLCCLSFDLRLLVTPLVSFSHCVVCPSIYGFWLLLLCLLVIVLSVLWFTASDYSFGVFWPLCCLSFDLRLLITLLVSCVQCVVSPVIYGFCWLLWCLVVSVVSALWLFTASDYSFGVLWSVCCLSCNLRLLITPLMSFGQCVVCPVIYGFWLLLWCLVVIVFSVLWFTASDYSFGILWSLRCLSCDLRLLITPMMSFGHCVVCPVIYGFWLLLWCLLVIVLSVLWFTASGYSYGILWSLCCLSCDLRFRITPLVSCGYCVVWLSNYGFWLLLWCFVAIVLSVLRCTASDYSFSVSLVIVLSVLWFTASDYSFGILWSLCCLLWFTASDDSFGVLCSVWCLSCDYLRLLVTHLVSFGQCGVCHVNYGFWLLLWCLVVIVLSVLWFAASDYSFGILWSLRCLSCDLRFWLLRWCILVIVLSVLWFTASDYSFGVFWSLCCLSCDLRLLVTPLVSCGDCVVFSFLWFTASGYSFGVLWSLCCLSCGLRLLVTLLVSCGHCVVWPSIYGFWLLLWCLLVNVLSVLRCTASDYSFCVFWSLCCLSCDLRLLITPLVSCGHCVVSCELRFLITPLVSFCHCVVCPVIYGFWFLCWCLVVIMLSVLWFTASDYSFGVFWSLCCLFFDLRLLITPLVSFGHWVLCPLFYGFWLLPWYLVVIELSVLWFTASDYSFGVLWSFRCLSFDWRHLITPLMSCGHWVVCPLIYGFWLLLWCLVVIELSVLWFTVSDYSFGVFWSLSCLSFDLQLLITPLVSCGHWVVCPLIYGFRLLLWCLLVIELSVLWFTASDYSFGVLWSLSCLSFDLQLLITPVVSCGHWVVCPVIYGFWLLRWCLVVIELSALWFTASDYSFGVFWLLSCLSFDLQLLITLLVFGGHWVVCPLIYGFWLLLWCLLVSVVSVMWITASGYSFGVL